MARFSDKIPSTEWGPVAWSEFHTFALNYPVNPSEIDINRAINYYQRVFPNYVECRTCRTDYINMIRTLIIRPYHKDDLFNWTVDIHNLVNSKIGKPNITYRRAYQIWTNDYYHSPNIIDKFNSYFDGRKKLKYGVTL